MFDDTFCLEHWDSGMDSFVPTTTEMDYMQLALLFLSVDIGKITPISCTSSIMTAFKQQLLEISHDGMNGELMSARRFTVLGLPSTLEGQIEMATTIRLFALM